MGLVSKKYKLLTGKAEKTEGKKDLILAIYGREGSVWFENLITKDREEVYAGLEKAMQILTIREQHILNLNFGLNGEERVSLTEIRSKTRYSRDSYIRIKTEAILKLRNCSNYISTGKGVKEMEALIPVRNTTKAKNGKLTRNDLAQLDIEELRLSMLSYNNLKKAGISTMLELIEFYANGDEEAIQNIKGIGINCAQEILSALKEYINWYLHLFNILKTRQLPSFFVLTTKYILGRKLFY